MHDDDNRYGLDTSIVLRLLTGEPPPQTAAALRFLDEMNDSRVPVYVSDLVVAEAYYALQHFYAVPKNIALSKLLAMFESGLVRPESGSALIDILKLTQTSFQKPGFVDRMIHAHYQKSARKLVTFEKAAKKLVGTVVLK